MFPLTWPSAEVRVQDEFPVAATEIEGEEEEEEDNPSGFHDTDEEVED